MTIVNKEKTEYSSQMLLVPIFVELSAESTHQLSMRLEELESKGFSLRAFGTCSFLVEAVPTAFEHIDLEEFLRYVASSTDVQLEEALKAPSFQKGIKSLGSNMAPYIIKKLLACADPASAMMRLKHEEIAER